MENKKNKLIKVNLTTRINNLLIFPSARGGFIIFLIIISAYGGIKSIYAQEQWRIFSMQNSGLPGGARCMVVDRNNVKWIRTNNGLARLEGNNWIVYDTSNSPLPFAQIFSIAVDSLTVYGWVSGRAGVW